MDSVTVEIDDRIAQAFDRLGDAAASILDAVARESAENVQRDVQSRLRRRWHGTGRTADAVTVEKAEGGYRVTSGNMQERPANLPVWLNYGTKFMTGEPAWDAAVTLENGTFLRRVEDGLQRAIDGLGD